MIKRLPTNGKQKKFLLEKFKRLFSFFNHYPIIYFVIFALYGFLVYKYGTEQTSLPEVLQPRELTKYIGTRLTEDGAYLRTKNLNASACNQHSSLAEKHFCLLGWNYINFINYIDLNIRPVLFKTPKSVQLLPIHNMVEAIAFGGALKFSDLQMSQVTVSAQWMPFVLEGYGFFSLYSLYRQGLNYPLSTLCPKADNQDICLFGIGQAAYYLDYKKKDLSFSKALMDGFDFASALGGGEELDPAKPTRLQLVAKAILNQKKDPDNKYLQCLKKNHTIKCI